MAAEPKFVDLEEHPELLERVNDVRASGDCPISPGARGDGCHHYRTET